MNFQNAIRSWMYSCFNYQNKDTQIEAVHSKTRALRFLEEAIELFQTEYPNKIHAQEVLDYVYNRPVGIAAQEVGGVMVTLAALCSSIHVDMENESWREFFRIDTPEMMEKIRNKQQTKPQGLLEAICDECYKNVSKCECLPF